MDRYYVEIDNQTRLDTIFKNCKVTRITDEVVRVETTEEYIYYVKEDNTTYIGKLGEVEENEAPEILDKDIEFIYDKSWTNNSINVSINIINKELKDKGYTLEYSFNKYDWKSYKEPLEIEHNLDIYARVKSLEGYRSREIKESIKNIDKQSPPEFDPIIILNEDCISIKVSTNVQDEPDENGYYGASGIKNYRFSNDGGTTWTDIQEDNEYTFTNLTQKTNYDFKIEVVDNVGNERISNIKSSMTGVAKTNGIVYDTLIKAIDIAEDNTETEVFLLTDICDIINIPSNKNIKLFAEGRKIDETTINVYGKLEINNKNTEKENWTKINGDSNVVHVFSEASIFINGSVIKGKNTVVYIENNGLCAFRSGSIYNDSTSTAVINKEGNFYMSGGTISSDGIGILNYGKDTTDSSGKSTKSGHVAINGGIIWGNNNSCIHNNGGQVELLQGIDTMANKSTVNCTLVNIEWQGSYGNMDIRAGNIYNADSDLFLYNNSNLYFENNMYSNVFKGKVYPKDANAGLHDGYN